MNLRQKRKYYYKLLKARLIDYDTYLKKMRELKKLG